MLLALPAFALWTAGATYRASVAADHARQINDAFEAARHAVALEESLERKYRLEPDAEVRARHRAAAMAMVGALEQAGSLGADKGFVSDTIAAHARYLTAIERLFAAIDGRDNVAATAIDGTEVDPTFDAIERRIVAIAADSRADELRQFGLMRTIGATVLLATPVVFALGAALVVFFWLVLRATQRRAEDATRHEAAATRQRAQRFHSLLQNASDVILICTAPGAITYQSPAAATGWGYGVDELLDQPILALAHPDGQPALRELWEQVRHGEGSFTAGTTRSSEIQLRDQAGAWRHAQIILTNLLREPSVAGVVVTIRDIRERKAFERQLTQQAFYDSLTGLPNRALFRDRLHHALVRAARRGTSVGVLFLDLDNFKLINDSLGHQVGDELLVQAAARLQSCLRAEDTVARLGGDEFVVLFEHLLNDVDAWPIATAIAQQFSRAFRLGGRDVTVTASMGVAVGDGGTDQADNLLRNADVAMYRAKGTGKARFVVFDTSMHMDALSRLELEGDLRAAITNQELRVHYQPIVDMTSAHIGEIEALVRWQHPTRGLVPPSEFIHIAEETGLIVPLGQWVLEEACRQVVAWQAEFPTDPPLTLSVNLSPRQFQSHNLVEDISRTLRETGLAPGCLKLEITEGVIMRDVEATITTLWQLKNLGAKLAVDDFGTGYSSLAYLKRLPLDVLKIDRSFVMGLGHDQEDTAIVRAIISLAKSLELSITSEGIETPEQAALLGAWGCDRGQGYYYGKPLDGAATAAVLRLIGPAARRPQVA